VARRRPERLHRLWLVAALGLTCLVLQLGARGAQAAPALVEVATLDARFSFDIRYDTPDNFTGEVLYPVARCLIRPEVGAMLVRAQAYLDEHAPGYTLLFKDCYRPARVQRRMWAAVVGTPKQRYVANPDSKTGSVHCYGAAVDVTLRGPDGREVDMGTPYDFLGRLAEVRREEAHRATGLLSEAQLENRRRLRRAMRDGGGFLVLSTEWWHFDALRGKALRARYERLDLSLDSFRP